MASHVTRETTKQSQFNQTTDLFRPILFSTVEKENIKHLNIRSVDYKVGEKTTTTSNSFGESVLDTITFFLLFLLPFEEIEIRLNSQWNARRCDYVNKRKQMETISIWNYYIITHDIKIHIIDRLNRFLCSLSRFHEREKTFIEKGEVITRLLSRLDGLKFYLEPV